jgi:hypothetical protein
MDRCETIINSGVLILENTPKTWLVIGEMFRSKSIILEGSRLEQDILHSLVKDLNVSRCALPLAHFTGHCQFAHLDDSPVANVTTYHVHCISDHNEKLAHLTHFLNSAAIPGWTFNHAELSRNYFNPEHFDQDAPKSYPYLKH